MEGLRNFIEVDNHNAVDVGGLRRGIRSITYPVGDGTSSREGADELTLRVKKWVRCELSSIAFCQASHKGIEGHEQVGSAAL